MFPFAKAVINLLGSVADEDLERQLITSISIFTGAHSDSNTCAAVTLSLYTQLLYPAKVTGPNSKTELEFVVVPFWPSIPVIERRFVMRYTQNNENMTRVGRKTVRKCTSRGRGSDPVIPLDYIPPT